MTITYYCNVKLCMNTKSPTHAVNNIITFSGKYMCDSRKMNIDQGRIFGNIIETFNEEK